MANNNPLMYLHSCLLELSYDCLQWEYSLWTNHALGEHLSGIICTSDKVSLLYLWHKYRMCTALCFLAVPLSDITPALPPAARILGSDSTMSSKHMSYFCDLFTSMNFCNARSFRNCKSLQLEGVWDGDLQEWTANPEDQSVGPNVASLGDNRNH